MANVKRVLSDDTIVLLALLQTPWRGERLVVGTAVGLGESGGQPDIYSRVDRADEKWGVSKGLFQIRPLHSDRGTGRPRDELRLADPFFNTASAGVIWDEAGDSFRPWGAFTDGGYRQYLPRARRAVELIMSWRLVDSLKQLFAEANVLAPERSRASDGTIGDADHSSRTSDHNPEDDGTPKRPEDTVDAADITHDPDGGWDCNVRVAQIVQRRDKRVKYIIWNKHIWSGNEGPQPWVKRWYGDWSTGKNPHDKHAHISILDAFQDDTSKWFPTSATTVGFLMNLTPAEQTEVLENSRDIKTALFTKDDDDAKEAGGRGESVVDLLVSIRSGQKDIIARLEALEAKEADADPPS